MDYVVYADGAYSLDTKKAGCAYCILTKDTYVASDSIRVDNIDSSAHAETVSIGLACAYLLDSNILKPEDSVMIKTDSQSAIDFCTMCIETKRTPSSNHVVRGAMTILIQVSEKCSLSFTKDFGHKNVLCPNTYVDRLAKIAIRRD